MEFITIFCVIIALLMIAFLIGTALVALIGALTSEGRVLLVFAFIVLLLLILFG